MNSIQVICLSAVGFALTLVVFAAWVEYDFRRNVQRDIDRWERRKPTTASVDLDMDINDWGDN